MKNTGMEEYAFFYESTLSPIPGLKVGILLEVGFDTTAPNRPCDISSWVWEYANDAGVSVFDNRALNVFCYLPGYTFVEKLQTIVRKKDFIKKKMKCQKTFCAIITMFFSF